MIFRSTLMPFVATIEGIKTPAIAGISSKGACKDNMGACFFEAKLAKNSKSLVESDTSGSTGGVRHPKASASTKMESRRTSRDATLSSCTSGNKGEGPEEHSRGRQMSSKPTRGEPQTRWTGEKGPKISKSLASISPASEVCNTPLFVTLIKSCLVSQK
jgi:hypothetical protein